MQINMNNKYDLKSLNDRSFFINKKIIATLDHFWSSSMSTQLWVAPYRGRHLLYL